jgi:hypothetical protein
MATVAGSTPPTAPSSLPPGIPSKPKAKNFLPPVAWLFGRQFIASLKYVLLYTAFKGKLDARDWMKTEVIPPDGDSPIKLNQFWTRGGETREAADDAQPEEETEFWFDYISDTGDGQRAVYSIAYLCMSDLAISQDARPNQRLEFVLRPDATALEGAGKVLLPRGAFLFVGGDTSYHISDYATLANRLQNPFWWAFGDLAGKVESVAGKRQGLLFGIPGNHDYYDSLDGFNRQFRRPATEDKVMAGKRPPLLMLPTFVRQQEASYLALRLPFDWWFWGLDTENGEIDFRQLEFFQDLQARYAPKKLIVATPEPTTAFGKFAGDDENQSKTFAALGLERPFLKNPEPLGEGKCRVDLSGDIHHYARHWGAKPESESTSNYTSVMAGGGGAFFHPSQTNVGEVPQQVLYPQAKPSRVEVANQLFKFRNIVRGGFVWLFGFLIAFILFFAASFPQSSRDAVDSFPLWVKLGVSPPVESQRPDEPPAAYVKPMERYTWGPNAPPKPPAFFLWIISLALALVALGAALIYSAKLFKKEYDPERTKKKNKVERKQRIIVWTLVFVGFAFLAFGILGFRSHEPLLTRYARSILILTALLWAVLAVAQSIRYSGWLFEEAYGGNIKTRHYWPIWVLLIMSVLGFGASLWFFGKHESAYLISDLVQLIVLLVVGVGLICFAYGTGGKLAKGKSKLGFLLLGLSHAILQLAVPFLLIRKGHLLWAPLAALGIVLVFKFIGRELAKLEDGWPLAIAWTLFGAALLVTPFVFHASPLNMPEDGWSKLLLCLYAGAVGALMSCALFGWYLAVALAFNGHNNEAGGAARIEGFKQLIRFRLSRDGLTGYVIAIDQVGTDGSKLEPQLVDVFRISSAK